MEEFVYIMFSLLSPKKSINFKKRKYRTKTERQPNLSQLTEILCDLLSLLSKYF